MKNALFCGFFLFLAAFTFPRQVLAQVKQSNLTKPQISRGIDQGNGLLIRKHLEKLGYKQGRTLSSSKYTGRDQTGDFEVVLIAVEYTGAKKKPVEQSHIELIRGTKKDVHDFADDGIQSFTVNGAQVQQKSAGCDPVAVARAIINTKSSCTTCVNQVTACINNSKKPGRAWKIVACLLKNAVVPCAGCVVNFVQLINAIVACV